MAKITPYWKWNRWAILFLGHWPKKSSVVVELHSSNIEGRFFIGGVLVWSQQFRDLSAEKTVEKRSWPARFSPHFFLSLDHRPSNREWILTLITLERQTIMDWYVASFKPQSWRTKNRCPEQNELFPPLWTSKREKSIPKHLWGIQSIDIHPHVNHWVVGVEMKDISSILHDSLQQFNAAKCSNDCVE